MLQGADGGVFFESKPGYIVLSDGAVFSGYMPSYQTEDTIAEVVFTTGMSGYVESLSDPSYSGEILVFTYPLIGNYGVNKDDMESPVVRASGVVVSTAESDWNHAQADRSLLAWLREYNIPIIYGVDTRALTKHLRSHGTMIGAISAHTDVKLPKKLAPSFVTIDEPKEYGEGEKTVLLVDCGAKGNIITELVSRGVRVLRVPMDYDFTTVEADGVMLSNGPGDPTDYAVTVANVKKALKQDRPIFGICLGNQLLALAAGGSTYRLKFGHRGHNQPCLANQKGSAYITSQNHGYAVSEESLPRGWKVSFRNLNDDSVEGIHHVSKPFSSVQFHPEACPGPTDTSWLFDDFVGSL